MVCGYDIGYGDSVYYGCSSCLSERITGRWTDEVMNIQHPYKEPAKIIKPNYKKENYRKLYWR